MNEQQEKIRKELNDQFGPDGKCNYLLDLLFGLEASFQTMVLGLQEFVVDTNNKFEVCQGNFQGIGTALQVIADKAGLNEQSNVSQSDQPASEPGPGPKGPSSESGKPIKTPRKSKFAPPTSSS